MDYKEFILLGCLVWAISMLGIVIALFLRELRGERVAFHATLERMMVMNKSQTIEEYAAVEAKLHRERLEETPRPPVEGDFARKPEKQSAVTQMWKRAPIPVDKE